MERSINIIASVIASFALIIIVWFTVSFLFYDGQEALGGGFYYFEESRFINYSGYKYKHELGDTTDVFVPPMVLEYKKTHEYIFVKQEPPKYDDALYYGRVSYPYGRAVLYYWIIVKSSKELIGPLSMTEFQSKLQELGEEGVIFSE